MKKNIIKSIIMLCCVFVFSISSAFALKNVSNTFAISNKYWARFYPEGGSWLYGDANSRYKELPYNDKLYLNDNELKIKKDGCELEGWKVKSTGKILKEYVDSVENSEHLYAVWKCNAVKKYSVNFNLNGANGNVNSQVVNEGATVSKPTNPTREGHTFLYWSTSSNGSEYNFNAQVKSNFTLYAIWRINTYTVNFNLNGGSGSVSNKVVNYGKTVSKPINPTREGHTFLYWSTSSNGSEYNFNAQVKSNFTLYAIWKKNESTPTVQPTPTPQPAPAPSPQPTPTPTPSVYYTVNFELNGGSGEISSQKVEKGNKVSKPSDPVKDDSSFKGWYLDNTCNESFGFDTIVEKDLTLYACFSSVNVVEFNRKGLPFIYTYTKEFSDNFNLASYKSKPNIVIFDTTTYSMLNESKCPSKLKSKCDSLISLFNCGDNKCYGSKYIILEENESKDIIELVNSEVISVQYELYNYLGLFNDSSCKNEYKYSEKTSENLNLYECYDLKEDDIVEVKTKKKLSTPLVLLVVGILLFVSFVAFLIFKGKIANKVN